MRYSLREGRRSEVLKVFEDYCTVTQSVRAGVAVDVEIRDSTGTIVHTSIDEAR